MVVADTDPAVVVADTAVPPKEVMALVGMDTAEDMVKMTDMVHHLAVVTEVALLADTEVPQEAAVDTAAERVLAEMATEDTGDIR